MQVLGHMAGHVERRYTVIPSRAVNRRYVGIGTGLGFTVADIRAKKAMIHKNPESESIRDSVN